MPHAVDRTPLTHRGAAAAALSLQGNTLCHAPHRAQPRRHLWPASQAETPTYAQPLASIPCHLRACNATCLAACLPAGAVGGTWRDHNFPNAGTDTEVPTYYPSFLPTPETSSQFGERDEILSYFAPVFAHFRSSVKISEDLNGGFSPNLAQLIQPGGKASPGQRNQYLIGLP